MASVWKHPASPFWVACFTVYRPNGSQRWKRSLKIEDRKLARKIADVLDDAGRGAMSEEEITFFGEKIRDARAEICRAKGLCRIHSWLLPFRKNRRDLALQRQIGSIVTVSCALSELQEEPHKK
jgi:hypothetical protein